MELQEELMVEILARLPVVALLRCKTVCRSWRSLIEDPYFIADHLRRSSSDRGISTRFLISRYCSDTDSKYFISLLSSDTLDLIRRIEIPTADPYGYVHIIGSSYGVVCLLSSYGISLLNPATGEFGLVAEPFEPSTPSPLRVYYGFGYSRSISDHKLIRIVRLIGSRPRCLAHVFTIRDGVWREVPTPNCDIVYKFEGAVVGEVVHWIARGGGQRGCPDVIVTFDLGNDKFGRQSLPDVCDQEGVSKRLFVFEESLRLIVYSVLLRDRDRGLFVWVRSAQDIWIRLARIDPEPVLRVHRPVGWGAREEIFIENDSGKLVAYQATTGAVRNICFDGSVYFDFHMYMESLTPLMTLRSAQHSRLRGSMYRNPNLC